MDLAEAVYRGWNIASNEGARLWMWHNMIQDLTYAVLGGGLNDVSTMIAERGTGPWDRIVLSEHIWI